MVEEMVEEAVQVVHAEKKEILPNPQEIQQVTGLLINKTGAQERAFIIGKDVAGSLQFVVLDSLSPQTTPAGVSREAYTEFMLDQSRASRTRSVELAAPIERIGSIDTLEVLPDSRVQLSMTIEGADRTLTYTAQQLLDILCNPDNIVYFDNPSRTGPEQPDEHDQFLVLLPISTSLRQPDVPEEYVPFLLSYQDGMESVGHGHSAIGPAGQILERLIHGLAQADATATNNVQRIIDAVTSRPDQRAIEEDGIEQTYGTQRLAVEPEITTRMAQLLALREYFQHHTINEQRLQQLIADIAKNQRYDSHTTTGVIRELFPDFAAKTNIIEAQLEKADIKTKQTATLPDTEPFWSPGEQKAEILRSKEVRESLRASQQILSAEAKQLIENLIDEGSLYETKENIALVFSLLFLCMFVVSVGFLIYGGMKMDISAFVGGAVGFGVGMGGFSFSAEVLEKASAQVESSLQSARSKIEHEIDMQEMRKQRLSHADSANDTTATTTTNAQKRRKLNQKL